MRDIIWTVIVVWLIYKVVDVFRASTAKRAFDPNTQSHGDPQNRTHVHQHVSKPEKDIKNAVKKHLNNEGEYIDFEEVK